ncbi:transglycosylase family protein [Nocardioides mesophilus]|uniref:Transglycosylase family protein n=2 Tax=Nocardioides mesophilus TaxID=433659 RepID=A0A7G9RHG7_9ACTN|nr:transglycosylase family protein [Nocardioides mesophilus]
MAVVATGAGYAAMSKNVTLTVDGQQRDVTVLGSTVGDVLASEGIEVGDRDVVVPGVDTPVNDGTSVSVKYARPLDVTLDGDETRYWVTATDVTSALDQLGLDYRNADLSTSRGADIDRSGMALEVVTPKKLTVQIAGKKPRTENVTALTVGEALIELGVKVDKLDQVKPGVDATLEDGDRIVFTDIRKVKRTARESIGFDSVTKSDASMYDGQSETVRSGHAGLRRVLYRVTLRNGEVADRKALKVVVLRKPVDALTKVGTKDRPAPKPAPAPEPAPAPAAAPAANYASGGTVWDQLAKCESGGNWAINTGNGYYGGLQFNLSTWRAYGGSGYPHQNSRETQIAIATKVRDANGGYGSWPACSQSLGLPQ